jgi:hypothetical protein
MRRSCGYASREGARHAKVAPRIFRITVRFAYLSHCNCELVRAKGSEYVEIKLAGSKRLS